MVYKNPFTCHSTMCCYCVVFVDPEKVYPLTFPLSNNTCTTPTTLVLVYL